MSTLNPQQMRNLLKPKNIYEYLFSGSLGTWNTAPVDLELKYDARPVYLRPYTVPRVHEAMFRKEVNRLVLLGIFKEANDSEWISPPFAHTDPKMDCKGFLSDFRNLNRQLKRKPYLMLKQLEFH